MKYRITISTDKGFIRGTGIGDRNTLEDAVRARYGVCGVSLVRIA